MPASPGFVPKGAHRKRFGASLRVWHFLRLTRPLFLLGGVQLYALGAAYAWKQGVVLEPGTFLLGQALVTAVQLMTHYANEFYDQETDRLNAAGRTWFSGGSGVLAEGHLSPQLALRAGLWMAFAATALLVPLGVRSPVVMGLGLLSIFLAWFYSAPPLAFVRRGWGELSASLVVALLVPVFSYAQQTGGRIDYSLLLVCLPLVLVHWAMLVAFQIPDIAADMETGKRTVSVRLGMRRALHLHNLLLILAGFTAWFLVFTGSDALRYVWLALPLAVWQGVAAFHYLRPAPPRNLWLTMRALGLFALCAFLWLVGITFG